MKKTSEKQIRANKKNAQLGGVKTKEGKEVTKFNAMKHGILKTTISEYENVDYELLYSSLLQEFPPNNTLEQILLERIAIAYIKLMRVAKAEKELIKTAIDPTVVEKLLDFETYESKSGYKPVVTEKHMELLASRYSRYETSIENRMYKAINKLLKLRQDAE